MLLIFLQVFTSDFDNPLKIEQLITHTKAPQTTAQHCSRTLKKQMTNFLRKLTYTTNYLSSANFDFTNEVKNMFLSYLFKYNNCQDFL